MFSLFLIFFALIGALIGSFVYASVLRIGRHEGVALTTKHTAARSHCDQCGHTLSVVDLIPICSFILYRGRCRYCHAPIQKGHLIAEVWLTFFGILIALTELSLERQIILFIYCAILLFIFFYDFYYFRILDRITVPAIVFAAVCGVVVFGRSWQDLLLGVVCAGGFFVLQYALSRGRWIGDGDIRLGILMGLMLGFQSTLAALFLAYVVGAGFALVLLATKKAAMSSRLPFGTFLSVATMGALLYGDAIVNWYLHLIHYTV